MREPFLVIFQDRTTPPTPHETRVLTPSESLPNIRYGKVTPVGIPYVSTLLSISLFKHVDRSLSTQIKAYVRLYCYSVAYGDCKY